MKILSNYVTCYTTRCQDDQRTVYLLTTRCKHAVREAATISPAPCKMTFDLESDVRVRCDVGYLRANFSISRPLCSRLRPDVRDRRRDARQTDVRRQTRIIA